MSLEAKVTLLNEMEKALSTELTAADMTRVLSILSDVLQPFQVSVSLAGDAGGNDDLLKSYLAAMQVQGRSSKTLERYEYILRRMMQSVSVPTRNITVYHLRAFLAAEKQRGIADSTLESTRQVFSAYFGWLWRESLIPSNPVANLGSIKCQKKVKEIFDETDLERLKNGCKTIRDRAIIMFLKSSACRISEMTSLNRGDIDYTNRECIVLGKGNKQRTVYLSRVACMLLKEYELSRKDENPALFAGLRGERLQPGGVRQMLKELSARTGVEHVHPHKFRRTEITELVKRGMPIEQVRELAGHEKLDTTMGYVVMDNTTVKGSYQKFA